MRVADSGHDGRQPEEEGRAGQHVKGDDERDGELVGALVAEQLRALETGLNSKPRDVCTISYGTSVFPHRSTNREKEAHLIFEVDLRNGEDV